MQTPAHVDYARAHSVDEALDLLERHGGEARLIAGGHSLIPMMRLRIAQPECVIDINDLSDLDYSRSVATNGQHHLAIGAMTRHKSLLTSPVIGEHYTILHDAERVIADPIVRNRGTIGGSLCQADPAEDLSAVLSAQRADVVIKSRSGTRTVPVRELADGPYPTVLADAEILTEVRIPIRPGVGSAYEKRVREGGAPQPGTGRSPRSAPMSCWTARPSATWGSAWPPWASSTAARPTPRTTCAAGTSPTRPWPRPAGSPPRPAVRAPTSAVRSPKSCTWPMDSPAGRCAAPPTARREGSDMQDHDQPGRSPDQPQRRAVGVQMTVNGVEHTSEVEPRMLLVHYLRNTLGLTGTHWGCDTSQCGTCVAWLDEEPVKTCTVLAAMADGHRLRTVEGLATNGTLRPDSWRNTACSADSAPPAC